MSKRFEVVEKSNESPKPRFTVVENADSPKTQTDPVAQDISNSQYAAYIPVSERKLESQQNTEPSVNSRELRKAEDRMRRAKKEYEAEKKNKPSRMQEGFHSLMGDKDIYIDPVKDKIRKKKDEYDLAREKYLSLAYGDAESRKNKYKELNSKENLTDLEESERDVLKKIVWDDKVEKFETVKNKVVDTKDKVKEHASNIWDAGAAQFSEGVTESLALILEKFGAKNNWFRKLNNQFENELDYYSNQMQKSAADLGDKKNISGYIGTSVVRALPDVIITIASAGLAGAATTATTLGKSAAGLISKAAICFSNMLKNPATYTSFLQEFGNNYEEAIENGSSDTKAMISALTTTSINTGIEMGFGLEGAGGIQTLPELVKDASKGAAAKAWISSTLGEGGEEILQKGVSDIFARILYDEDREFNPLEQLEAGVMGTLVGGILGGGQVTISSILSARSNQEFKKIGSEIKKDENAQDIIKYAARSLDPQIRALATNTNVKNVSPENMGKMYQYMLKDIHDAINSPEDANTATENFDEIMKNTESEWIKNIASYQYIERLTEKGVDEKSILKNIEQYYTQEETKSLDSQTADGYNNNRGDENATFDDGGLRESVSDTITAENTGRNQTLRGIRQEDAESFLRRTSQDMGGTRRVVESENSALAYVPAESDNTAPSIAVDILNGLGANAVYVKGNIESNQNGVTHIDNQALTAPDGTVYVSSSATLSDIKIAAHEIIHVKQKQNSPEYIAFESVVSENIMWGSEEYLKIARNLNQAQYNGKYDVEDISFSKKFITEITAYINEFVATDPERAERNFALLCKDWQAVVDASKQFNKAIGADFSESAFSMQSEGREQLFTEPDTKEIARDYTPEDAISAMATGETKNARQKQIESVAGNFGLKIRWSNKVSRGTYNHVTKTITINPDLSLSQMYVEVFKHEFVHWLERKQGYKRFRDELFESDIFADFCRRLTGKESESSSQAISDAVTFMYDSYRSSKEISKPIRDKFTMKDAEKELVAELVSRELLKGDRASLERLQQMAEQKPNVVQRIINWVKELIYNLKGTPQNKTLLNDLEYLEKRLGEVMHSANKLTSPFGRKTQYSVEYNRAIANNKISELVKKVQSGNFKDNEKVYLKDVSKDVADKIYDLTGVYVQGFKVAIEARQIEHILKDHGENGLSDRSMSNINDISKIEYVLINYDSIVPAGKTKAYRNMKNGRNKTVDTVLYEKNIGENSYYVIQAVPDAKSKTLYIVSAFIGKSGYKKEAPQVINANSPDVTPEVEAVVASTNSISNSSENVNTDNSQHAINLPTQMKFNADVYADNLARVYNKKTNKLELRRAIDEIQEGINSKDLKIAEDASVRAANILMKNTDEYIPTTIIAREIFSNVYRGDSLSPNSAAVKMRQYRDGEIKDYKKRLSQLEKSNARKSEQLKKRRSEVVAEETARRNERSNKQKNIEYIRREVSRIDKKLRANSDKNPVPQELQEMVKAFCNVFLQNDQTVFDRKDLALVCLAYSNMAGDFQAGGESLLGAYDFDIDQQLKNLASTLEGKTLRNLSVAELSTIRDIVDNLRHMIVNENKLFLQGKSADIAEVAADARGEIRRNKAKVVTVFSKKHGETIFEQSTTPIYFFDKLGPTFRKLFDDIRDGQDKWFRNMEISKTYIQDIKEKYHYSEWGDDTFSFETVYGDKIELTREQALLLYATAKREYNNKAQGSEHLFKGGIVTNGEDIVSKTRNKIKKADKKKAFEIFKAFINEIDSKSHQITPIDVGTVNEWLTEEQKAYADELVKYLSIDMAALGNETSMQLFGIRKYNEDYYIPYNSAQNFLYSQPGVASEQRLKHQSFTKQTQKKARTPLMLTNFSEVCADHINRMCMYNAMTVPLENMNRVFNYSESGEKGFAPQSLKTDIESAFGKGALEYVQQFLTDMNGSVRSSSVDTDMSKWLSRFKKGAVFASASVVIQQPSAIARAFALVDEKYFLSSALNFSERDYQELVKYAPVAGIKEMGRFDTGMGVENVNWLLQQQPKGIREKVKAALSLTDSTYRDDLLTWTAAKADKITWAHIWAAVKAETEAKTDLKPGTDEFLEYAGKRFRDVIDYTQVYDSTLSRSQIMRSKSAGAKMLTAFMSEPTVSLNLLMDAARKKNAKYFSRALRAWIASVLLNAFLKSFVTAARDDDEDKSYFEKYIGQFVGNTASDLFVPNMIPLVKDVVSVFEGYTVERVDMSLFADLADSAEDVFNENKTLSEKITSVTNSLAAFVGLPVKNILRDVNAAKNVINEFFNSNKTTATGVKYSILEELPGGHSGKGEDVSKDLVTAAEKGDKKAYTKIYGYLEEQGKTESNIFSETKKAYKKNSDVKSATQRQMKGIKNTDAYKSLDADTQADIEKDIADHIASEKVVKNTYRNLDVYDELYEFKRKNKRKYDKFKQQLLDKGYTAKQIAEGEEVAKIAYLKSVGIDLNAYILSKKITSKDYADLDNSGGVSKKEKVIAIKNMDIEEEIKRLLIKYAIK